MTNERATKRLTRIRRWLPAVALALAIGCGNGTGSDPAPAGSTSTGPTATVTTTTGRSSTTVPAPLATPEDARRFLEDRGVDPGRLSEDIGEHMRRRFQPEPPP